MEPVRITVEEETLTLIARTLRECAEDLQAQLDSEYPADMRAQYPTYERRYQRDRRLVVDALHCLDVLAEIGVNTSEPSG